LLLYSLIAVVLAAAAVLVFNELRAAGLLKPRARPGARPPPEPIPAAAAAPDEDFSALDSVPPRERPVLVLRLLVQALTRSHRLELERPLTCRELVIRARFDNSAQREAFRDFALLAETARYDSRSSPPELPALLVSGARRLREELLTGPLAQVANP